MVSLHELKAVTMKKFRSGRKWLMSKFRRSCSEEPQERKLVIVCYCLLSHDFDEKDRLTSSCRDHQPTFAARTLLWVLMSMGKRDYILASDESTETDSLSRRNAVLIERAREDAQAMHRAAQLQRLNGST